MAKCLSEELWEKALEYCSNAYNHERITDAERVCKILEKENEPNACPHVHHYTEGMRAPVAVVYFEKQSEWRERDVYAACEECDRELQEWGNRVVACDRKMPGCYPGIFELSIQKTDLSMNQEITAFDVEHVGIG